MPKSLSGYLNIDKPTGITSADVVRRVKRATRAGKVGHGGTIDPLGSGVLPICIGTATRFAEFILHGTKEYRVTVHLGSATDTYDSEGAVTAESDASGLTQARVEAALPAFTGAIQQRPPAYSALKSGGKRLYELARAGVIIETEPRTVEVLRLRLTRWAWPDFDLDIECGHGFYARSLAFDIGGALRCASHLTALNRLRAGRFAIGDSTTLDGFEAAAERGDWQSLLLPVDWTVGHLPSVVLDELLEGRVRHGQSLPASAINEPVASVDAGIRMRAYNRAGELIALLEYHAASTSWKPGLVIPVPEHSVGG